MNKLARRALGGTDPHLTSSEIDSRPAETERFPAKDVGLILVAGQIRKANAL